MAIRRRSTIGIPTDGFSAVFSWVFWLAVLGAGGYGVFWAIGAIKSRADSEVDKNAPKAMASHRREQDQNTYAPTRNAPPAFPARQVAPELDRAGAEVNLIILAKEAARLKGDPVTQMEYARSLTAARSRLQQVAARESVTPETLEGNDEVLGIDELDFAKMQPAAAAVKITQVISRIPGNTFMKVRVRRGNERDVILYFSAPTGTGVVLAHPGFVKISNEFALEVQKQVLSLPPDQLTDFDRRQIEGILGRGEASDEEYAMLVQKLSGATARSGSWTRRAAARRTPAASAWTGRAGSPGRASPPRGTSWSAPRPSTLSRAPSRRAPASRSPSA